MSMQKKVKNNIFTTIYDFILYFIELGL